MINCSNLLELHRALIAIPSVSHNESEIADFIYERLQKTGANLERLGDNIIAWLGDTPKLLLNSHIDTVPPTNDWTLDPFTPVLKDGKVYGLGSNDTKGSVAAMITAFELAANQGLKGLAILLSPEEETGGKGTEVAWPWLRDERGWAPEGIIVGEPTELQVGVSQSGLLVLELVASGDACHAANALKLGATNPIFLLAQDLAQIPHLNLPTLPQPTVLTGSEAKNQIPAQATAILDIRTEPGHDHKRLIAEISQHMKSEVLVRSKRLIPYACPENASIIKSIQSVLPKAQAFHSQTMSDQVHFAGFNAVKFGPGVSARSHTSDEYIFEHEVIAGAEAYWAICQEFLK
ncbi:MAG: M20/M25/M40 family metallo-hydrolase [Fimbriimonadaceae bacterium]|nr:MAG: M20/M25/M40 family metallo-hydrolase [Fimbriimonadaceae bacterium]